MSTIDKYLTWKKRFAILLGFLVLWVSFNFSKAGFGFVVPGAEWIGVILALGVTAAQLIFNTRVSNLNWTIFVVGILSYAYSIYTNIIGFYSYTGLSFAWDATAVIPVLAGVFVDVFPEMALAWGFGASTEGDLLGNILTVANDKKVFDPKIMSSLPKSTSYPVLRKSRPTMGYNHFGVENKDEHSQ